jgi:hypothetical protein
MLADMKDGRVGVDGAEGSEDSEGFDGKIFKFVGDDLAVFGEAMKRGRVVEGSIEAKIGNGGCGAGGIGIEDGNAVAHSTSGQGEHAAELASADDSDGLAWGDHR